MVDRAHVQEWLDRYIAAWESYDPGAIGALFSEDAEYRYRALDDPIAGREAIVQAWLAPGGDPNARDKPGTYEGRYEVYAVDGDRAVGIGRTWYWEDASRSKLIGLWDNVYLLEFDAGGQCRSFTEIPSDRTPAA